MLVMEHTNNISEISKLTSISTRSIQRYLNNEDLLKEARLKDEESLTLKSGLKKLKMMD